MKSSELKGIVADVLEIEPEELTSDTDLTEIETFDSVAILVLMTDLDERAHIRMSPTDARNIRYYRDIEELAAAQGVSLD